MAEQNPLITQSYKLFSNQVKYIRDNYGLSKIEARRRLVVILANKTGVLPKDFIIKNLNNKQLSTIISELS